MAAGERIGVDDDAFADAALVDHVLEYTDSGTVPILDRRPVLEREVYDRRSERVRRRRYSPAKPNRPLGASDRFRRITSCQAHAGDISDQLSARGRGSGWQLGVAVTW